MDVHNLVSELRYTTIAVIPSLSGSTRSIGETFGSYQPIITPLQSFMVSILVLFQATLSPTLNIPQACIVVFIALVILVLAIVW